MLTSDDNPPDELSEAPSLPGTALEDVWTLQSLLNIGEKGKEGAREIPVSCRQTCGTRVQGAGLLGQNPKWSEIHQRHRHRLTHC